MRSSSGLRALPGEPPSLLLRLLVLSPSLLFCWCSVVALALFLGNLGPVAIPPGRESCHGCLGSSSPLPSVSVAFVFGSVSPSQPLCFLLLAFCTYVQGTAGESCMLSVAHETLSLSVLAPRGTHRSPDLCSCARCLHKMGAPLRRTFQPARGLSLTCHHRASRACALRCAISRWSFPGCVWCSAATPARQGLRLTPPTQ